MLESRAKPIVLDDQDPACTYQVSTDDARVIAEMLVDAGLERDLSEPRRDEYIVLDQGARIGYVFFDAFLPDGELVEYGQ